MENKKVTITIEIEMPGETAARLIKFGEMHRVLVATEDLARDIIAGSDVIALADPVSKVSSKFDSLPMFRIDELEEAGII
jgi:hypothetical protein